MKRQTRNLIFVLTILIAVIFSGSYFYYKVEKLSIIDSVYLATMTITTVGYGDYVPKTNEGKIFTIFYSIIGIGIALYAITLIANNFVIRNIEKQMKRFKKRIIKK